MAKQVKERLQIGTDEQGRPIYRWVSATNKQDLFQRIASILSEKGMVNSISASDEADNLKVETICFGDYLRTFLDTYKSMQRPSTIANREQIVKKHIQPRIGKIPIDQITTADIQKWFNELCSKGYARETILKIKNIISPAFDSAIEDELIVRNPVKSSRLVINTQRQTHHQAIPWEKAQEVRAGLAELPFRERMICALLCYTGLRIGEVLGLQWEHIDWENRLIQVTCTIEHPVRNRPVVTPPKTQSSERTVPMISRLEEILKPYKDSKGYIVSGEEPLTYQQLKRSMDKIREQFDLGEYTAHDFRDTCATEWLEAGIPLPTISKLLGHKDSGVTEKYYTKFRQISLESARKIMESIA